MVIPDKPIVAVVQVGTQPPGVLHQVVLDPAKAKNGIIIRIGEYPGDEYNGWQYVQNVAIVVKLGNLIFDSESKSYKCVPDEVKDAVVAEATPAL